MSEHEVRLPRVYLPTADREESQAEQPVCELHSSGQRKSSEGHTGNHAAAELPKSNGSEPAGHFPAAQPRSSGMDSLLREVLSFSTVSGFQALQQNVGGLGDAEVSTGQGDKTRASRFLEGMAENQPHLFVHWQRGMAGAFA